MCIRCVVDGADRQAGCTDGWRDIFAADIAVVDGLWLLPSKMLLCSVQFSAHYKTLVVVELVCVLLAQLVWHGCCQGSRCLDAQLQEGCVFIIQLQMMLGL